MSSTTDDTALCRICGFWGADIRIGGCGCHVHARCLPLVFINNGISSGGRETGGQPCPCCSSPVTGLYLLPLSFHELEESVGLRKIEALKKKKNKHAHDDEDAETEARYLVFSQGRNTVSNTLSDTDNARTGRWTEEEVAYVDHLVQAFDKGKLPLPQGVKLSAFLGDILLCKASRLTKKMKNAKLSARSFEVSEQSIATLVKEDAQVFSALQDRFIGSMSTKIAQLELKFNLVKQWRTYFSNLCIQIGFQGLDASDWISSVEEIERRASKSEEQMRIVRRKRMGLGTNNTEYRPMKAARSEPILQDIMAKPLPASAPAVAASTSDPNLLNRQRTFSDDLDNAIMSLYDQGGNNFHSSFEEEKGALTVAKAPKQTNDPFLETLTIYMENSELPFQHVDVWVPSFTNGNGDQVQLLHAGHATRRDQGGNLLDTLNNFGEFSKSFTFHPNNGLPGKVYAAGKAQWEFQLSNPNHFPRYKGAKAYGLQTAVAIPISTPGVGRMVVIFYSCSKVIEDQPFVNRCTNELTSYAPTPKWKLVIEIGDLSANLPRGSPAITKKASNLEKSSGSIFLNQMVTLLGNELASASSVNGCSQDTPRHIMGMRLLLLKPASSRSPKDNDLVGILEGSYKAYTKDNKRGPSELARLLIAEYMCLNSLDMSGNPPMLQGSTSQSLLQGSPSQSLLHGSHSQSLLHKSQPQPNQLQKMPQQHEPVKEGEGIGMPAKHYSSTQLPVNVAALPPLFGRGISGPPTRLPSVLSNSNSAKSLSTILRRTVSVSRIPPATGIFPVQDPSFNEQPPSF